MSIRGSVFPNGRHYGELPPTADASPSSHYRLYQQKLNENQCFLSLVAFVRCFMARNRKVTNSLGFGLRPWLGAFHPFPENIPLYSPLSTLEKKTKETKWEKLGVVSAQQHEIVLYLASVARAAMQCGVK